MLKFPLPSSVLALSGCLLLSPLGAQPELSVAGVRVVGEAYGDDSGMGLRAFNWNPGSYLAVLLVHGPGGLIDFDAEASELREFKDDTGQSLLSGTANRFGEGIRSFVSFSEDGKAMMFEVESTRLPAEGARSLSAKGTVAVVTASGETTDRSEPFAVEEGGKLEVGGIGFSLKNFGAPQWSQKNYEFSLALEAKQDLGAIREVRFLNAAGEPIEHEAGSRNRMQMMSSVTETWSFNFSSKPAELVVELVLYTGTETIQIPFDLTATIAL